ncbi:GGDEF domain-containing protein [Mycobacterium sp. 2YAF39]|uniref:GGDEF domain-containing protein n=1 Tax=Mycobacterium sp. 2YAF39 TaxID=3233033 RepID=UPI003F94F548
MAAVGRSERNRDHYYWLTAFLAARGLQTRTCLVVAGMIISAGSIPLVTAASPAGASYFWGRIVAVVGALCSVAMAAVWLRNRWPTRMTSETCVLIGTVYIASASLMATNPVVGLLGSTAFAILGGFIALFHSMRLLVFMWVVGAATVVALAVRVAQTDGVLAITGALLVGLVNVFTVFACRTLLRSITSDVQLDDLEPLTNLLTQDAFAEQTATLMSSRDRGGDRYLMVAVVNLDSFSLYRDMSGVAAADRARVAVGQRLRETVRQVALIAHVSDAEFLIADVLNTDDPSPFVERVRATIASSPSRMTASIGVVSTAMSPLAGHPPYDVLDEVLSVATAAMHEARREGGNRAKLILSPALSVLDRPAGGIWSAEESA